MKISLLGIGAVKIQLEEFAIYIDAVNSFNSMPTLTEKDILLFTHGDADHFLVDKFNKNNINNQVIGPPNVILELYRSPKIDKGKLKDFLPHEYGKPIKHEIENIEIDIFNTPHFIDWQNTHVSFLIHAEGKKVFITGDSHIQRADYDFIRGADCLIYSLLDYDVVKGKAEKRIGLYKHLLEIYELQRDLAPKTIIGNHLLNCDWAVDSNELKELLNREKFENVEIVTSETDIIKL